MFAITVVTITKNDTSGLEMTARSVEKLLERLDVSRFDLAWIIKSGDAIESLADYGLNINRQLTDRTRLITGIDSGIYDAMSKAVDLVNDGYVVFMNSGDRFEVDGMLSLLDIADERHKCTGKSPIFFGRPRWNSGADPGLKILPKFMPRLGRLPNHQCMLIPVALQRQLGFDQGLPVSADKDFKIRAYLQKTPFVASPEYTAICQPGGRSQLIRDHSELRRRAEELYRLMEKNYSKSWALVYAGLFFLWNSRKLFRSNLK